jgi:hypothetical protein
MLPIAAPPINAIMIIKRYKEKNNYSHDANKLCNAILSIEMKAQFIGIVCFYAAFEANLFK